MHSLTLQLSGGVLSVGVVGHSSDGHDIICAIVERVYVRTSRC